LAHMNEAWIDLDNDEKYSNLTQVEDQVALKRITSARRLKWHFQSILIMGL
jgi:hypothetical protein